MPISVLRILRGLALTLGFLLTTLPASAQTLTFATIDRPPFAKETADGFTGFSIELMQAIATEMGRTVTFQKFDRFSDMFAALGSGDVDGAIANISITASREAIMDFTHPIFDAGLQIMVPRDSGGPNIFSALFTWDLALAILAAVALLFGGGLLMWWFERNRQPYFDRPAREALFPSFWWALNLVVNGGFEERVPQSRPGRFFAVVLVISSLFIVSIFVARITAAMTVEAITGNIQSMSDLDGRRIGSTTGSTASAYLETRGLGHVGYDDLAPMLRDFEAGKLEAVVFDGPILAWYIRTEGASHGRLLPPVFKPENYGIALPSQSPLMEEINRALLSLRESGDYETLRRKYFGTGS
ncbi:transporter substrate-binding domain-containing protein [Rhodobacteraceae bacterium D3-12]|nr:transporter substrate-binding domain-containing protein [Rhodobacteraceae bacterium D3-12]